LKAIYNKKVSEMNKERGAFWVLLIRDKEGNKNLLGVPEPWSISL
jgi:hypothetical protein